MIGKIFSFIKKYIAYLTLLLPVKSFAIALSIIPLGALPQSVPLGKTVTAAYSVINNSGGFRSNNYVSTLPPNVNLAAGGCGSTFTLAPAGQPGSSCTLNLVVTGAVNGNDPNPKHHLFICFPGGKSCIGTNFPLNVTQSAVPPPTIVSLAVTSLSSNMLIGRSQQLVATATYSDGSTSDLSSSVIWTSSTPATVSVSNTGVASAVTPGSVTISAKSGTLTSPTIGVTSNNYAYLGTSPNVYLCTPSSGLLTNCNPNPTAVGYSFFAINPAHTFGYITLGTGGYRICPVNIDGTLSSCTTTTTSTNRLLLNPAATFAISLLNSYPNSLVRVCPVNQTTGALGTCTSYGEATFNSPANGTINAAGTFLYVSELNPIVTYQAITVCSINPTTGVLACGDTGLSFFPYGIAVNGPGNFLYVATGLSTAPLNICNINSTTGAISGCTAATGQSFNSASNISFDSTGTHMYVTEGSTVWVCTPNSVNGSYSGCVNSNSLTLTNAANVTFTN